MRKDKKLLKKENIVYFPGLQQRLLAMGIEHLEMKKFDEAANFLLQARELDTDSPEIGTALLLALFETGKYTDAKVLSEEMLKKGNGDYFEIIDVYLIVLIQLREYNKVVETINVLIEEKEVPPSKLEHYEKLLHFSEKRAINHINVSNGREKDDSSILKSKNIEEQILEVAELMNVNIHPFMNELMNFLNDSHQHPFVQTMIINVLKEHGIDKEIKIKKFHFKDSIVPTQLIPLFETTFYKSLIDFMEEKIEQKNPSLYEQIKTLVDKHFFLLYPFEFESEDISLWTAAYHSLGLELYGEFINTEKMAERYHIESAEMQKTVGFLKQLEEISLPIL